MRSRFEPVTAMTLMFTIVALLVSPWAVLVGKIV